MLVFNIIGSISANQRAISEPKRLGLDLSVLIVGSNGRFAKSFNSVLSNSISVRKIGYEELKNNGFDSAKDNFEEITTILWCIGAGNSRASIQSDELGMLVRFFEKVSQFGRGLNKFIYLSTGGMMYGVNPGEVYESSPVRPVGTHGLLKFRCEEYIKSCFGSVFEQILILRLPNAYSLDYTAENLGFIDTAWRNLNLNKRIEITVDPESTRQYGTHLDFAKYISDEFVVCQNSLQNPQTINIDGGETLSIRQILNLFDVTSPGRLLIDDLGGVRNSVILRSEHAPKKSFNWTGLSEMLLSKLSN